MGLLLLGAGLIAGVMLSLAGIRTIGPGISAGGQQGGKNAVPLANTLATAAVAAVPFLLATLTGIVKTATA
jgi:hypothetical protein